MSDEHKDFRYHVPFHEDDDGHHHHPPSASLAYTPFDPSAYMSFTDCLQYGTMDYNTLTKAFGLSSSSEVVSTIEVEPQKPVEGGDFSGGGGGGSSSEIPVSTPNSSVSFSSGEAAGDQEDSGKSAEVDRQQKESDDGRESSKKGNKEKKKIQKRQKEPRFAFMTKSEVDHLEDGYRWRKYGQKAVKNSPYPRSYYRCTTQKCTVKKRVERSYQDRTIVITTYEGQHNHPIPTTLRGNAAAMFSHSIFTPAPMAARPDFSQDHFLLSSMSNQLLGGAGGGVSSLFPQNINHQQNQGQYQVPDYGLLQDVVPSMFLKKEP